VHYIFIKDIPNYKEIISVWARDPESMRAIAIRTTLPAPDRRPLSADRRLSVAIVRRIGLFFYFQLFRIVPYPTFNEEAPVFSNALLRDGNVRASPCSSKVRSR
jgi:hypothetical protein